MTYVEDEDGNQVSEECMLFCTPVHVAECEAPHCQCGCHDDDLGTEQARDAGPGVGGFGPSAAAQAGRGGT